MAMNYGERAKGRVLCNEVWLLAFGYKLRTYGPYMRVDIWVASYLEGLGEPEGHVSVTVYSQ